MRGTIFSHLGTKGTISSDADTGCLKFGDESGNLYLYFEDSEQIAETINQLEQLKKAAMFKQKEGAA